MIASLSVIAGVVLVGLVFWEVFHDLFDPAGRAALTGVVAKSYFALLRPRRLLSIAGPLTLVTVITIWVVGLVLGFALIYLPFYPSAFRTAIGTIPWDAHRFLAALYISAETLTTLGYGDLPARARGIRVVTTIEGLVGFALLTASVSSIVLIYPALTRMRHLALSVRNIVRAEPAAGIALPSTGSDVILAALASGVTHARIDLVHFPIVYYFSPSSSDASIAKWTGALCLFAREARSADRPAHVCFAGATLDAALDHLASLLAKEFLDLEADRPRDEIFDAFAKYQAVEREFRAPIAN